MPPPALHASTSTAVATRADGWFSMVEVRDVDGLHAHLEAWRDLAAHALEPNVFHEPWCLLPALRRFGSDQDLRFLLVYRAGEHAPAPVLCGFFPLVRGRLGALPGRCVLGMWQHLYGFLHVPLLRDDAPEACLEAVLDWLRRDRGGAAIWDLEFPTDGPFARILEAVRTRRRLASFEVQCCDRAIFRPRSSGESYLAEALPARRRKDLRRKERLLQGQGTLAFRQLEPAGDVESWIDAFLNLEASGWKGREGTALACHPEDAELFRQMVREGVAQGQAVLCGLFLDDRPIALKINLYAAGPCEGKIVGFAFKIAYDEAFASSSPGLLLEVAWIEQGRAPASLGWLDSCAVPDQELFRRLWLDRRSLRRVYLATGRTGSGLLVGLLPAARAMKRCLNRLRRCFRRAAPQPE